MTSAPTGWTLRGRLARTFLAVGVLVAVLAAVCVVAIVRFSRTADDVINRYQPALAASQRMLADLVNQETGVRGYLLTHRAESLDPYNQYRTQQRLDTTRVIQLVGSDAQLSRLTTAFTSAATGWQRRVAEPAIADVRVGQGDPSAIDAGKTAFDRIRTAGAALTDALRSRTLDARDERTRLGYVVISTLLAGLVLLLLAGIVVWIGLRRWVLAPVMGLAGQTRVVAGGELHHEIVPTGPGELTALGADVESMRRQIASELARVEEIADELARSNADLQQFAYVASHDLSEPLRKVSNFCQLLERQYGPQLDDRARQYIWFAVDGAKRMQTLITDLLSLSRVGRTTENFADLDLDLALDQALRTLSDRIADAGARVDRPPSLPTVWGDRSLLTSLFENLVGNAVKYRREDVAPVVGISVEVDEQGAWLFTVQDNGIGIEAQYGERIFAVFQRLHLRDQYGGTGIGLALCRKIVEFHGGRIWLDPVQSAPGSTFRFTLPEGHPRAEPPG